jgi:hypothetical protein
MNDPFEIPLPVWEDLVQDFLEMACFLTSGEREHLIGEIDKEGVASDALRVFPSFMIDRRLIVICEEGIASDCWIYYPKERRIEKARFTI